MKRACHNLGDTIYKSHIWWRTCIQNIFKNTLTTQQWENNPIKMGDIFEWMLHQRDKWIANKYKETWKPASCYVCGWFRSDNECEMVFDYTGTHLITWGPTVATTLPAEFPLDILVQFYKWHTWGLSSHRQGPHWYGLLVWLVWDIHREPEAGSAAGRWRAPRIRSC